MPWTQLLTDCGHVNLLWLINCSSMCLKHNSESVSKITGFSFFHYLFHFGGRLHCVSCGDLGSTTRSGTHPAPTVEALSLNHWTARQVPCVFPFDGPKCASYKQWLRIRGPEWPSTCKFLPLNCHLLDTERRITRIISERAPWRLINGNEMLSTMPALRSCSISAYQWKRTRFFWKVSSVLLLNSFCSLFTHTRTHICICSVCVLMCIHHWVFDEFWTQAWTSVLQSFLQLTNCEFCKMM